MSIIEINSFNFGSTGNIMLQISEAAEKEGYKVITCCPKSRNNDRKQVDNQLLIGNRFTRNLHLFLNAFTGLNGCFSFFSTLKFLKAIDKENPELIHLHNLHNCYINLPLLFNYIKKKNIPVVWTLHDCWAFTGQCPHFVMANCDKWKSGCFKCPSYREYPSSKIDMTKLMWRLKKRWFTGIQNLTVVTPSKWLCGLSQQSFLKDYPVRLIYNGIDLNVFKPIDSNFRATYGINKEQIMLLGVSSSWGNRKGLDVFIDLADRLGKKYVIVLVGTTDEDDRLLPPNIISIHKTNNQNELAEIYSAADIFINPTREEVLGLVNIEAQACGTPVITFNTGGSPECITDNSGYIINCNDIDSLCEKIDVLSNTNRISSEDCIKSARHFDRNTIYSEYISLYNSLLSGNTSPISKMLK